MQELEKILEEIENLQDISGWDLQTVQGILKIIRKHMNDGWIPVKERLPAVEKKSYLVTYQAKNGRRYVKEAYCEYTGESPYAAYWTKKNKGEVIAWMPLPEPYREDEVEKDEENM